MLDGGNMSGNKVKIMTRGAMLASVFGVLGLINIYTGSFFDIIFAYIMVLAIAYYTYLYDYKAGLSVVAVTFIILFLIGELFFTFYATITLSLGLFYGYCLYHHKSKKFAKYGLMIVSAVKNFVIFYLLSGILQIDFFKESLEIYREIINFLPLLKNFISPDITYFLLWLLMFICESYVVRSYFDIVLYKIKKNK